MSDLDKFLELYASLGIELRVGSYNTGYKFIRLIPKNRTLYGDATSHESFEGQKYNHTEIFFDENGKYLKTYLWCEDYYEGRA
jgi:hypothetical protein